MNKKPNSYLLCQIREYIGVTFAEWWLIWTDGGCEQCRTYGRIFVTNIPRLEQTMSDLGIPVRREQRDLAFLEPDKENEAFWNGWNRGEAGKGMKVATNGTCQFPATEAVA